jgi:hypothetical protein
MHILISQPLEPSTMYKYKVRTWSQATQYHESNVFEFHTPVSQLESFKFLAAGDIVTE